MNCIGHYKNETKITKFAVTPDSSTGMCNSKTVKTSIYEHIDKAMVLWLNEERGTGIPVSGTVCFTKAKHFF